MVKFLSILLAVTALVAGGASVRAQDLPSLAVFPAISTDTVRSQFGDGRLDAQELVRQLEESLRATRRFSLFERSGEILMKSVRLEQDFAQGGQALANVAQAGKLANVQFIVQPLITLASVSVRRTQREEAPGQFRYSVSASVTVSVKVLDTTSGQIMFQTTREAALPVLNEAGSRQTGAGEEPLVRATAWRMLSTDVAARLTNAVVGSLFPLQVVQAQGSDIFVNRGEGGGILTGETYQLFSAGEALIDPVTKEKLGDAEQLLGEVQIIRVNPRFSVARAKSTLSGPVKAGDVLRPLP